MKYLWYSMQVWYWQWRLARAREENTRLRQEVIDLGGAHLLVGRGL
jgi:hypothetical protein